MIGMVKILQSWTVFICSCVCVCKMLVCTCWLSYWSWQILQTFFLLYLAREALRLIENREKKITKMATKTLKWAHVCNLWDKQKLNGLKLPRPQLPCSLRMLSVRICQLLVRWMNEQLNETLSCKSITATRHRIGDSNHPHMVNFES